MVLVVEGFIGLLMKKNTQIESFNMVFKMTFNQFTSPVILIKNRFWSWKNAKHPNITHHSSSPTQNSDKSLLCRYFPMPASELLIHENNKDRGRSYRIQNGHWSTQRATNAKESKYTEWKTIPSWRCWFIMWLQSKHTKLEAWQRPVHWREQPISSATELSEKTWLL